MPPSEDTAPLPCTRPHAPLRRCGRNARNDTPGALRDSCIIYARSGAAFWALPQPTGTTQKHPARPSAPRHLSHAPSAQTALQRQLQPLRMALVQRLVVSGALEAPAPGPGLLRGLRDGGASALPRAVPRTAGLQRRALSLRVYAEGAEPSPAWPAPG